MDKKVYEITFSESDVINKKVKIEAESMVDALVVFHLEHPDTTYDAIEEVKE